jgi:hypothetical protein
MNFSDFSVNLPNDKKRVFLRCDFLILIQSQPISRKNKFNRNKIGYKISYFYLNAI